MKLEVAKMRKKKAAIPQIDKSKVKSKVFQKKQNVRAYIDQTKGKTYHDLKQELLE